jgi:phosphoglucomutase
MMREFRDAPPRSLDGSPVIRIDDYQASHSRDPRDGKERPIDLPKSNVLIFSTQDGTRLAARPSGTEPKIKFYVSVEGEIHNPEAYQEVKAALDQKIDRILEELKLNG